MNTDVLTKEILGEPVTVAIRGRAFPLAYPMHNVIAYRQQTLDSLFDAASWSKIDLKQDPERWLACLWAGLHERQDDGSWKSPFTIDELGALVDFSNAGEISVAMVKALTAFMPKKEASPNAAAPGEPALEKKREEEDDEPEIPLVSTSGSFGPKPVLVSTSAASNS